MLINPLVIRIAQLVGQVTEEEQLHQAAGERLSEMENGREAEITDLKTQLETAVASSKVTRVNAWT